MKLVIYPVNAFTYCVFRATLIAIFRSLGDSILCFFLKNIFSNTTPFHLSLLNYKSLDFQLTSRVVWYKRLSLDGDYMLCRNRNISIKNVTFLPKNGILKIEKSNGRSQTDCQSDEVYSIHQRLNNASTLANTLRKIINLLSGFIFFTPLPTQEVIVTSKNIGADFVPYHLFSLISVDKDFATRKTPHLNINGTNKRISALWQNLGKSKQSLCLFACFKHQNKSPLIPSCTQL